MRGARIQEFSSGGSVFSKNFDKKGGGAGRTKEKKRGGGVFNIYSAPIRSKSLLDIETAFQTITYINTVGEGVAVFSPLKKHYLESCIHLK